MKIKELRENEPLKVIEISLHVKRPTVNRGNPEIDEFRKIQTRIFTDGEIEKESEETSQNIEEYYIGENKYQYGIDTLKTKNIYFKNHSYVITYLIANELVTIGNLRGWFDIVKDISIYLKNSKDKKALKDAKQVIREFKNRSKSIDYSSILGRLSSLGKELEHFKIEKISKNVYSLKKTK